MMNPNWIYDEEIYPNFWFMGLKDPITGERKSFEISPWVDNRHELLQFLLALRELGGAMIGYNNLKFDYPLLNKLIGELFQARGRDVCMSLFQYANRLIKGGMYPNVRNPFIKQIDCFLINHFDNQAKATSLKMLEFNLRTKNLQELPFPPGTILTGPQARITRDYCHNDTDATHQVYDETIPEIELREKLSPMFGIDFTNYNSTKMGEQILISRIVEELGESVVYNIYETDTGTKKRIKNTKREQIDFSEVVFDYIKFDTKPFQKILEWFKSKVITETKGVFSNIPLEDLSIIDGHYNMAKTGWNEAREMMVVKPLIGTKKIGAEKIKVLKTLNINNFDFQYDFGVGGIHGSIISGVYEEDDEYEIRDIDVASYYPNLAIQNGFYPEHLGKEFCDVYLSIYEERKKYPKKTHKMENLALKLALNGSYGKSNSEYSALYDPMYTMKTTVNGQLLLCMLSEQLMLRIPQCIMLQINTDGMTIKYPRAFKGLVDVICQSWEEQTKLELEHAYYSRMVIKDVNNYLAVYTDGGVKRKGAAFIYKQSPGELELHKNFSQLVVPKALEAYFVDGVAIEDSIMNHDDVYDFFKRVKIRRSDYLFSTVLKESGEFGDTADELQRLTRYLVTGEVCVREDKTHHPIGVGKTLVKQMPAVASKVVKMMTDEKVSRQEAEKALIRRNMVEAGYLCTVANTYDDLEIYRNMIYYPYYISEAEKVIKQIEYVQTNAGPT